MTLKQLLNVWLNGDDKLNVTAMAYNSFGEYYSFRTLANVFLSEMHVKDWKNEFSEDELSLEVISVYNHENTLWIDVKEIVDV